jgi:hypothetical protein
MRYNRLILPIMLALIVLPLSAARSALAAGDQSAPQGFRILLSDGSVLKGAVSFTMSIDTQYGRLTVPSANFVSARFNSTDGWADIHTTGIQLRVQYKPASSTLNAATDVGPVSVDLTKVVTVESLNAEVSNPAPPAASSPYDQGTQAPSSDIYSEPATIIDFTPNQFAGSSPYYSPSYYQPYCYPFSYASGYPNCYPYFSWPAFGFSVFGDFDDFHHGHHDGFAGRFHDRDSGFAWNRGGARNSAAAAVPPAGGRTGLSSAASGRAFGSSSFRDAATPSSRSTAQGFQSGATTGFRNTDSRTFRNEGATTLRNGAGSAFRNEGATTFRSGSNRTFSSGGTTTFRSGSNRIFSSGGTTTFGSSSPTFRSGGTTTFRSATPTFRSGGSTTFRSSGGSSFRNSATPSFQSFSAPSFHSSASSSFHSGGTQFSRGGGFSSGGGFARGGGFSGGGFSHGGGRGR